jgi:L-serine dehydratase
MFISAFELYRVGPGPSSSHTVGPQRAAMRFVHDLAADGLFPATSQVEVELYGGLAFTGREQGADRAVIAGLSGKDPGRCDAATLAACMARADADGSILLDGRQRVDFAPARDLRYVVDRSVAHDGNALRFIARDLYGRIVSSRVYFSTGNGAVLSEDDAERGIPMPRVPYEFATGEALLAACRARGKKISELARANECALFSPAEVRTGLLQVAQTMRVAVERGMTIEGMLPGGRERTAPALADGMRSKPPVPSQRCAVYATAVAEENAAGGRVVSAPSSGAAGPMAALLQMWRDSAPMQFDDDAVDFLLTGAAIGGLLRQAGIRHIGCQSEIGVAAAMAAAGFAAVQKGSSTQVLYAAERALELHRGLACDPVGGRIQDPCIARNGLAATRAYDAAMAAVRQPAPRNGIDLLVRSLIESGRAMSERYKVASIGGIAVNVAEC